MPALTTLVDFTVPVAADFMNNFNVLNQAIGTSTAITSYTTGDMPYASATNTLSKLAIGANKKKVGSTGTAPEWVNDVLTVNTTSTVSTQTAKETLATYSLPAATLATNAEAIEIMAWGTAKATANNKTQTIDFGGTTVASTGAVANNGGVWQLRATIFRTSATAQAAVGSALSATTPALSNSTPAETLSGAITINITSTNVTDTDGTTFKGLLVHFVNGG